jgi:hypothetical protein
LSSGKRPLGSRADYSGSSKNTIALIVREAVKATAEPLMMPTRSAMGRRRTTPQTNEFFAKHQLNCSATAI